MSKHLDPTIPFFNDMIHVVLNSCTITSQFVTYLLCFVQVLRVWSGASRTRFVFREGYLFVLGLYGMWTVDGICTHMDGVIFASISDFGVVWVNTQVALLRYLLYVLDFS